MICMFPAIGIVLLILFGVGGFLAGPAEQLVPLVVLGCRLLRWIGW